MPTVAVTGATGLLGNNLVRMLVARGEHHVRALLRLTSGSRALDGVAASVIRVDLARATQQEIVRAIDGMDVIVHCGARVGIGREQLEGYRAANAHATANLASACRQTGARLVHVSTVDTMRWGTRENPGTEDDKPGPTHGIPYVITKREAEGAVLAEVKRGLDAVIVNPAYILGPWDWKPSSGRMLIKAASAPMLIAPPGGNDFVHVEDVAKGILAAIQHGRTGERYILGGQAMSYTEAFQLFADIAGRQRRARTAPPWLVRAAGTGAQLRGMITGGEYDVNTASAEVSTLPHHFSSARAERELGYTHRPAAEAARDAWKWFRAHGYV